MADKRDTKDSLVQDMHPGRIELPASPVRVPVAERLLKGPLLAIALGCAYFVAADLSLALVAVPEQVAVFWPASGLAAGLLIALGPRFRWIVAFAVIGATLATNLIARSSIGATVAFAVCNAFECLIAAWLFRCLDPAGRHLETIRSVFAFVIAAAVATALVAVPAGLALRTFQLSRAPLEQLWFVWFKSDALGILVIAPIIVTLAAIWHRRPPARVLVEGMVAVLAIGLASIHASRMTTDATTGPMIPPAAMVFPIMLWLASRLPPFFSASAVLVFTLVVSWTAFSGEGRFGDASIPISDRILSGQLAMATFSVVSLAMAAAFTNARSLMRALAVSEERLRLALNAASSYAFDHDFSTDSVTRVGDILTELDLPRVGHHEDLLAQMHPEDVASFKQMLSGISPTSPLAYGRFRLRKRDGSYIHIGHRSEARYDASGKLVRVVGTSTDVTRRVRQEQALEDSQARLLMALRAGRVFAFEWDLGTDVVQRSENAAEILGIRPDQLRMTRAELFKSVVAEDVDQLQTSITDLTLAQPASEARYRFNRPDGRLIWLEVIHEGQFDPAGTLVRVRGLTRDVTALKQAEERQQQLIAELDHRVKNSLARVSAVIDRSREGHDTVESYSEALSGRVATMARSHDLLRSNAWTGVEVATIVADELEPYRNDRNASVTGPRIKLSSDAAQALSLTLHELATNAAKHGAFSCADGRVGVSWSLQERDGAQRLLIEWSEHMVATLAGTPKEGFGLRTIRNLLAFELGARVRIEFTAHGVACSIDIPAARAVVDAPGS